ncbi:S8 family serine peptidase [Actinoplanes sp. HUAS TT8]|uniref:S8 family serine peptidase n=1 Tax=Actinoplanes sp. HUAS TT8 TaxID=3447453 RepID=UPI003F528450
MRRAVAAVVAALTVLSLAVAARAAVAEPGADHYIVVLRQPSAVSKRLGLHADREFHYALTGFAAALSDSDLAALRADPAVRYVEPDGTVVPDAGGPYRADVGASTSTGAGVTAYTVDCGAHGDEASAVLRYWAPGVREYGVQACGTTSAVLAAVDAITAERVGPTVVALGLSGSPSRALDDAVAASVRSGVVYTVTAGGRGHDTCGYSPSRSSAVITVGANPRLDLGPCVTLFAGTPVVAAAAARYLENHPAAHPAAVKNWLIGNAAKGILHNLHGDTPNRLLQLGEPTG